LYYVGRSNNCSQLYGLNLIENTDLAEHYSQKAIRVAENYFGGTFIEH